MGLLQKAYETYDLHKDYIGKSREGHATLLPISHTLTNANIEITIDNNGKFISARKVEPDEPKTIIPVTEESCGRTSAPCAHPLCDQVQYIASYDKIKHDGYLSQLKQWSESTYSHPKVDAIYRYIQKDSVLKDLLSANCISLNEKGIPDKPKAMIRWIVNGLGDSSGPTWEDASLFNSFIEYYQHTRGNDDSDLCMISGEISPKAKQHPKGVIPVHGNAKIISANDNANYTYRGRFTDSDQALAISYIASQKAHNAIRWIAEEQSFQENHGGRVFLCWCPNGKKIIKKASNPLLSRTEGVKIIPSEYREKLRNTIISFKKDNQIQGTETVVVAALDAATSGRLSVTYYSELPMSDFLQRLYDWDESCAWNHPFYGVECPSLWDYVIFAYGTERNGKFEIDDKVNAQHMQRMIAAKVDGGHFPSDIERALVCKASNLLPYSKLNRKKLLFTVCSAVRKYRKDRFKEEWDMSLDPNKEDISYQYGRLLAVMEKIETDTYMSGETRDPNAIRMQSVFVRRPLYASRILMEQLKRAYFPRISVPAKKYYEKIIGEILEKISMYPDDVQARSLGDTYLMGYYLQKNAFYEKTKDKELKKEEEE